jgi:Flp pilus assembly protein TadD
LRSAAVVAGAVLLLSGCVDTRADTEGSQIAGFLSDATKNAQNDFDYEVAVRHYQTLYERDGDHIEALLGFIRNLRYVGAPRDAIKIAKKGLAKHGKRADLTLELAKAYIAAALVGDAADTLKIAHRLAPDDWGVYATRGILLDRLGDFEKAQTDYRKALEIVPGNVEVRNNLALSLAQSGRLADGIRMLERVVRSENVTVQARQNLALLYALNGEFKNAERLASHDLPRDAVAENIATLRRLYE